MAQYPLSDEITGGVAPSPVDPARLAAMLQQQPASLGSVPFDPNDPYHWQLQQQAMGQMSLADTLLNIAAQDKRRAEAEVQQEIMDRGMIGMAGQMIPFVGAPLSGAIGAAQMRQAEGFPISEEMRQYGLIGQPSPPGALGMAQAKLPGAVERSLLSSLQPQGATPDQMAWQRGVAEPWQQQYSAQIYGEGPQPYIPGDPSAEMTPEEEHAFTEWLMGAATAATSPLGAPSAIAKASALFLPSLFPKALRQVRQADVRKLAQAIELSNLPPQAKTKALIALNKRARGVTKLDPASVQAMDPETKARYLESLEAGQTWTHAPELNREELIGLTKADIDAGKQAPLQAEGDLLRHGYGGKPERIGRQQQLLADALTGGEYSRTGFWPEQLGRAPGEEVRIPEAMESSINLINSWHQALAGAGIKLPPPEVPSPGPVGVTGQVTRASWKKRDPVTRQLTDDPMGQMTIQPATPQQEIASSGQPQRQGYSLADLEEVGDPPSGGGDISMRHGMGTGSGPGTQFIAEAGEITPRTIDRLARTLEGYPDLSPDIQMEVAESVQTVTSNQKEAQELISIAEALEKDGSQEASNLLTGMVLPELDKIYQQNQAIGANLLAIKQGRIGNVRATQGSTPLPYRTPAGGMDDPLVRQPYERLPTDPPQHTFLGESKEAGAELQASPGFEEGVGLKGEKPSQYDLGFGVNISPDPAKMKEQLSPEELLAKGINLDDPSTFPPISVWDEGKGKRVPGEGARYASGVPGQADPVRYPETGLGGASDFEKSLARNERLREEQAARQVADYAKRSKVARPGSVAARMEEIRKAESLEDMLKARALRDLGTKKETETHLVKMAAEQNRFNRAAQRGKKYKLPRQQEQWTHEVIDGNVVPKKSPKSKEITQSTRNKDMGIVNQSTAFLIAGGRGSKEAAYARALKNQGARVNTKNYTKDDVVGVFVQDTHSARKGSPVEALDMDMLKSATDSGATILTNKIPYGKASDKSYKMSKSASGSRLGITRQQERAVAKELKAQGYEEYGYPGSGMWVPGKKGTKVKTTEIPPKKSAEPTATLESIFGDDPVPSTMRSPVPGSDIRDVMDVRPGQDWETPKTTEAGKFIEQPGAPQEGKTLKTYERDRPETTEQIVREIEEDALGVWRKERDKALSQGYTKKEALRIADNAASQRERVLRDKLSKVRGQEATAPRPEAAPRRQEMGGEAAEAARRLQKMRGAPAQKAAEVPGASEKVINPRIGAGPVKGIEFKGENAQLESEIFDYLLGVAYPRLSKITDKQEAIAYLKARQGAERIMGMQGLANKARELVVNSKSGDVKQIATLRSWMNNPEKMLGISKKKN